MSLVFENTFEIRCKFFSSCISTINRFTTAIKSLYWCSFIPQYEELVTSRMQCIDIIGHQLYYTAYLVQRRPCPCPVKIFVPLNSQQAANSRPRTPHTIFCFYRFRLLLSHITKHPVSHLVPPYCPGFKDILVASSSIRVCYISPSRSILPVLYTYHRNHSFYK